MKLKVTDNFDAFRKALKLAGNKVESVRPVLAEYATRFLESRKFIFDENRSGAGRYVDLKPATKKRKTRKYGSPYPILQAEGDLRKSITKRGGDNITIVGKKSLTIGTKVKYAGVHQHLSLIHISEPTRPY